MASTCPSKSSTKTTSSSSSTTGLTSTTATSSSSSSLTATASIDVQSSSSSTNRPAKVSTNDRSYSINEQSIKQAMMATANKLTNQQQESNKTKGNIMNCPMSASMLQRKYSIGGELCNTGGSSGGGAAAAGSLSLDPSSSTITQQQQSLINRPETPTDEDKIDLKLISIALMKLFYPKATDAYDILLQIFQQRFQQQQLQQNQQWDYICKKFLNQCSLIDDETSSSSSTKKANGTILNSATPATSSSSSTTTTCQCQCSSRKGVVTPSMNSDLKFNLNDQEFFREKISQNYEQLELFTKFLIKNLNNNSSSSTNSTLLNATTSPTLNWEELIVECGEKYSLKILEQDSKALKFIGENLIDFLVNLENIQSIAYKEIGQLENFPNKPWQSSQLDLLPISVFVNHCETQIYLTYNILQPICRFVACFLSGLFQKMAKFLFHIVIRVKVEIGSDQYKFLIENRNQGLTLVNNNSFVQRYKTFLFNRPEQLLMSVDTFRRVFPFHFICDQNLRFIQYGTGLSKIFGTQNKLNVHISNVFQIQQPNVGFFFESIRHRINLAFILRVRDNILNENFRGMELQGQIIECVESKCLLFLGSPIVKGLQSLTSRGLFLSDIPIHDATRDIILIEEQSRAQESLKRRMDKLKDTIQKANKAVEIERQKNVDLLNLIFPAQVARQLWLGKSVEARQYDDVTMLFSDIVGFTAICSTASPMAIINMLNELYTQFDVFCGEIDVYKTETIGDAYCVASGLHRRTPYHAVLAAFMALKMMDAVKNFLPKDINVAKFQMRIGLHSGSCLAGIVGVRMPRYCLFGAHVTLANKFESHSQAQRINISPTTYRLLQKFEKFEFTMRDPSCLPKEYPKKENMEQISAFLDRYYHPRINDLDQKQKEESIQSIHIAKALEDIAKIDSINK